MKKDHFYLVICLIIAALLTLGYFFFLDGTVFNKIVEIKGHPVTTKNIYHPGENVYMYLSYCKYRAIPAEVEWTLIDEVVTFYTPTEKSGDDLSCKDNAEVLIEPIPMDAHPGMYHFHGLITYHANGLRDITVELKTNEFQIIK